MMDDDPASFREIIFQGFLWKSKPEMLAILRWKSIETLESLERSMTLNKLNVFFGVNIGCLGVFLCKL